jgi:hypothetical protein
MNADAPSHRPHAFLRRLAANVGTLIKKLMTMAMLAVLVLLGIRACQSTQARRFVRGTPSCR